MIKAGDKPQFGGYYKYSRWQEDIEFLLFSKPSHLTSGDYLYSNQNPDQLRIGIFDGMGHDIQGSSMSSILHSSKEVFEAYETPNALLLGVNNLIYGTIHDTDHSQGNLKITFDESYVTGNAICLTPQGLLTSSKASACPVMIFNVRTGKLIEKDEGGVGLLGQLIDPENVKDEAQKARAIKPPEFKIGQHQLQKGDIVFSYTDGFVEVLGKSFVQSLKSISIFPKNSVLPEIWNLIFETELNRFLFNDYKNLTNPQEIKNLTLKLYSQHKKTYSQLEAALGQASLHFLIKKHHKQSLPEILALINSWYEGIQLDDDAALTLIRWK